MSFFRSHFLAAVISIIYKSRRFKFNMSDRNLVSSSRRFFFFQKLSSLVNNRFAKLVVCLKLNVLRNDIGSSSGDINMFVSQVKAINKVALSSIEWRFEHYCWLYTWEERLCLWILLKIIVMNVAYLHLIRDYNKVICKLIVLRYSTVYCIFNEY